MSRRPERRYSSKRQTEETVLQSGETQWPLADSVKLLIGMGIVIAILIGGWQQWKNRLDQSDADLTQEINTVLFLEKLAVSNHDGDLFLSIQASDPAWLAAQLLPENQAPIRAGLSATEPERHGEFIWTNLSWEADGETWQRIAFFTNIEGQLVHVPTAPDYWGNLTASEYAWGILVFAELDRPWADTVAKFVANTITQTCAIDCLEDRVPLTLILSQDYGETAATGQLRIPSPRLLALDKNGSPAPAFWHTLQQKLEGYLTPADIRFALPPAQHRAGLAVIDYQQAARVFMILHPEIRIELITLNQLPDDLSELATNYDGAAIPPSEAMLAAGLIHDLTGYIVTDPIFDDGDFYEQIWQGARWQRRTWWLPQAADMRILFYDKMAYQQANRLKPSARWTWSDLEQDIASIVSAQPEDSGLTWGYIDNSLDTLYAYAYSWNNDCDTSTTAFCRAPLQDQNIVAALNWYGQQAGQPDRMPDVSQFTPADRNNIMLQWQGVRRKAAVWTDFPVNYEHQLLLLPVGVAAFPRSDTYEGITPLWVYGSFISQQSKYPLAVWEWLKFLSYQRPAPRLIPARPSVATEIRYWINLPEELGTVMRQAFPYARPVTAQDQVFFNWTLVSGVVAGDQTPNDAVQEQPHRVWFGIE